jgi:PAS domain S-box-containing protein
MKKIYNSNALRITLSYLIFGVLWIVLSDRLVELLASNGQSITTLQTYKGWAFVTATSLLLYILLDKVFNILQNEIEKHKSTIKLLRDTENKYSRLYDNLRDAFASADMNGNIIEHNSEFARMLGYNSEEIKNLTYEDVTPDRWHKFEDEIVKHQVLVRGFSDVYEKEYRRKDGAIFPVELRTILITDSEKQPKGMWAIIRDITDRKLAEEVLRRSRKEFQTYFNSSSVGLSVTAPDKTWIEVNQRLCEILGYTKEELIGLTWENLTHPEDVPENLKLIQQALDGKIDTYELDKRFIRKDGSIVYVTLSVVSQHNDDGSVHHFLSSYNDITERKLVEQALQKSEERYRLISNVASDYVFSSSVSDDGLLNLNWVAGAFENITGYTLDEYIAKGGWRATLHPDDLEIDQKDMADLKNNKQVISELRTFAKNGDIVWVRVYAHPIWDSKEENLVGINGAVQDITNRKLAEEKLIESHQLIEGIINTIPARVFWKDKNLIYLGCNEAFAIDAGFTDPNKVIGKDDFQMTWRNQAELYRNDDFQVIKSGTAKLLIEESQTTPEGKTITLLTSKIPLRNFKGEIIGILGTYVDITDRKLAQEKIREKDIQFRKLSAQVPDLIFQFTRSPDGKYFVPVASEGIKNIFGCSPEDVLENFDPIGRVIFPEDSARVISDIEYSAKHLSLFTCEFRVQIPGKSIQWIYSKSKPEKLADGSITWYGFNTDITERKKAEEALRDSEHKLRLLLESSEDIILMQDLDGRYLYYNGSEAYGIKAEEVIGKTPYDIHKPKYAEIIFKRIKQVANTGHALFIEDKIEWQNEMVWFSNGIFPVKNKEGKIISILTISRNISDHKQMEENLRESEERFHSMFENHNAVMLLIHPENGKIVDANISASKYYGYSITKLKQMNLNDLNIIPPDEFKTELDRAARESRTDANFPHKLSTGEIRLVEVSTTPIQLKGGVVLFSIIHDITKRKLAEQEVLESKEKLRALAGRLERVKEEERTALSRDLHDHLGQNLTGLKMDIAYLAKKIQTGISIEPEDFLSKTSGMIVLIDELINSVRRISAELRPNVLDYLGLIPAIEWQMEELKKRTDIDCVFKTNVKKVDLGNQINSSIFRIIQEAITNITRHSGATKVIVTIEEEKDIIKLEILDNGKGIKQDEISNARSLGILGMKERTFQFNGKLYLENAPNGGTLLTLIIPKSEG